jgi:hypothetical protein
MKGVRHFLRDFTATAVREHLRSEIEGTGGSPHLTKNEIELVRFIRDGSIDWSAFPAERSGSDSQIEGRAATPAAHLAGAGRRHGADESSKWT